MSEAIFAVSVRDRQEKKGNLPYLGTTIGGLATQDGSGTVAAAALKGWETDEGCCPVIRKEHTFQGTVNGTATGERTTFLTNGNYYKVYLSTLPACSMIALRRKVATDTHKDS